MLLGINHNCRQEELEGGLGGWRIEAKAYKGCWSDLSPGGVKSEMGGCWSFKGGNHCGLRQEMKAAERARIEDSD